VERRKVLGDRREVRSVAIGVHAWMD
jgi:hypothetical protein